MGNLFSSLLRSGRVESVRVAYDGKVTRIAFDSNDYDGEKHVPVGTLQRKAARALNVPEEELVLSVKSSRRKLAEPSKTLESYGVANKTEISAQRVARAPKVSLPQLAPQEEISKILDSVETELGQRIEQFIQDPPKDREAREDEHRVLSEIILAKTISLDNVQIANEQDRATRKRAIAKLQQYHHELDRTCNDLKVADHVAQEESERREAAGEERAENSEAGNAAKDGDEAEAVIEAHAESKAQREEKQEAEGAANIIPSEPQEEKAPKPEDDDEEFAEAKEEQDGGKVDPTDPREYLSRPHEHVADNAREHIGVSRERVPTEETLARPEESEPRTEKPHIDVAEDKAAAEAATEPPSGDLPADTDAAKGSEPAPQPQGHENVPTVEHAVSETHKGHAHEASAEASAEATPLAEVTSEATSEETKPEPIEEIKPEQATPSEESQPTGLTAEIDPATTAPPAETPVTGPTEAEKPEPSTAKSKKKKNNKKKKGKK